MTNPDFDAGEAPHRPESLPVVVVVDDDPASREEVLRVVQSRGLRALGFESSSAYRAAEVPPGPSCVILGIGTSCPSVVEFKRQIGGLEHPPIVCTGGSNEIPACTAAMKAGAIDYLSRPIAEAALLEAIDDAIASDADAARQRRARSELQGRYGGLTCREREVFALVVGGLLNKQAAASLGISEITLKSHRGRVMQKMAADSFADLVRMAFHLQLPLPRVGRSTRSPGAIADAAQQQWHRGHPEAGRYHRPIDGVRASA